MKLALLLAALPVALPPTAVSQSAAPPAGADPAPARPALARYDLGRDALALEGYDPVAYFPAGGGAPQKGSPERAVRHRGVVYRFASDANLERFLAAPEQYEPSYGGWCAWAMADGDRVGVDPRSFVVEDGELLLFYDGFLGDTRKRWLAGERPVLHARADREWAEHSGEAAPRPLAALALGADGLALGGHDPVAYTAEGGGAALVGRAELAARHRGATYRFASAEHREKFLRSPASFEPRYGGHDPAAFAEGRDVAGDPALFEVTERGLALFADAAAREAWRARRAELEAAADERWRELVGRPVRL